MPQAQTRYFGEMDYSEDAIVHLPAGLPGFESQHRFVLLQRPEQFPLVYLQSLSTPDLCFVGLPVLSVDPEYILWISEEDARVLGTSCWPAIGGDVLCISLVASRAMGASANLLAPVVVNLATRMGVQCFNLQDDYSHEHVLIPAREAARA